MVWTWKKRKTVAANISTLIGQSRGAGLIRHGLKWLSRSSLESYTNAVTWSSPLSTSHYNVPFPTALPASKAKLRNVFQSTRDLSRLRSHLHIPDNKRDIESAEYYAQSSDPRKMRNLIFQLDEMGDTALADSVMEYAEPPAGIYCNTTVSQLSYCLPVRLKPTIAWTVHYHGKRLQNHSLLPLHPL